MADNTDVKGELRCDCCGEVTALTCPECKAVPLCADCAKEFGDCDACALGDDEGDELDDDEDEDDDGDTFGGEDEDDDEDEDDA